MIIDKQAKSERLSLIEELQGCYSLEELKRLKLVKIDLDNQDLKHLKNAALATIKEMDDQIAALIAKKDVDFPDNLAVPVAAAPAAVDLDPPPAFRPDLADADPVVDGDPAAPVDVASATVTSSAPVVGPTDEQIATRKASLVDLKNALDLINQKYKEFKGKDDVSGFSDDTYFNASVAVERIYNAVNVQVNQYEAFAIDRNTFRTNIEAILIANKQDIELLKEHRGYGQVFVNFMTAIALFVVPYLFAAAAYGTWTLFPVPTDAGNKVDGLLKSADAVADDGVGVFKAADAKAAPSMADISLAL